MMVKKLYPKSLKIPSLFLSWIRVLMYFCVHSVRSPFKNKLVSPNTLGIYKISLYIIGIVLAIIILEYARQGFIHDVSLQPPINRQDTSNTPIYLISYADGKEHIFRNQNTMANSAVNKGFDVIFNYRKNLLDHNFIAKNQEILSEPFGAGMFLWKPYIILQTMRTAPPGAIIICLDSAFIFKKPIFGLTQYLQHNDVVLVHDRERKNGAFVKGDSFALMGCVSEKCRQAPHIWSAVVMVKNTVAARQFIEKWLKASEDIRILSNKNYQIKANYPEFAWHHFDQSVLSLVYFKNPTGVKMLEFEDTEAYLSWFHRKSGPSSPLKTWYSVYGADPVINLNKNGKTLSSTAILNIPPLVWIRKWWIENFM